MKNVYMVQASATYGGNIFKSAYLPYAAGLLVAYAWTDGTIKREYEFKRFIFTRETTDSAVESLDNPAVIGFSNYIWNTEYNKALAKKIKEKFPSCFIIFGGHNVPPGGDFLEKYPYIDLLTHAEGEEATRAVLLELLNEKPDFSSISNISFRGADGIVNNPVEVLTKTDYPSPYLTGVFDKIFEENPDMQLDAILETSRGCPNHCAYCDWGCTNSKIKLFPEERVLSEIDWFSEHKVAFLWGADANFGQFERDEKIVDYLIAKNKETGFPERLRTNYSKNQYERVFRISRKLDSVELSKEGATLSFQSLNPETLKNIGRTNMSLDKFGSLMKMYKEAGVTTYSELILGLPSETYESFCRGIGMLLEAGQHRLINVYNCEILPNSPMAQKDYMEKYGIKTADVVFLTAHSKAENEITERTNYVVATNTMNEEQWVKANIFACFEKAFHHYGILRCIAIYLHYEKGVRYEDFYNAVITNSASSGKHVIHNAYAFLDNFYNTVIREEPMRLYMNDVFGKITWAPEHVPHMDVIFRLDEFYDEMLPLFRSFGIDEEILSELIDYQKVTMKRPLMNNYTVDFTYDWHTYFENAVDGNYTPLVKKLCSVAVANEKTIENWKDYAIEAAWFGKNGNTFNPSLKVEYR